MYIIMVFKKNDQNAFSVYNNYMFLTLYILAERCRCLYTRLHFLPFSETNLKKITSKEKGFNTFIGKKYFQM